MKVRIGKRDQPKSKTKMSAKLEAARKFIEMDGGSMEAGLHLTLNASCKQCSAKYEIVFSENELIGEVFCEGPETCDCGAVLMTDPPNANLSQEDIVALFGG
jgi:hypothetical protein